MRVPSTVGRCPCQPSEERVLATHGACKERRPRIASRAATVETRSALPVRLFATESGSVKRGERAQAGGERLQETRDRDLDHLIAQETTL